MPFLLLLLLLATPAQAQTPQDVKCARYGAMWEEALARFGQTGLGAEFLGRHDTFLASGCRQRPAVCPRSLQEVAIADAMTFGTMNAGMASSFVPFLCRD